MTSVIQDRWASVIRDRVLVSAKSLKILDEGATSTAQLPEQYHAVMGPLCAKLLQRACECGVHVNTPRADAAITRSIQREVWNALVEISGAKFGTHVQHDFNFMPVLLEGSRSAIELTPQGVRELAPRTSNAKGSTP